MLTKIGSSPKNKPSDLTDLLLECHARIRHFSALAREVGRRTDVSDDETIEACREVERYFIEALPLHVKDEERSILPRLRACRDSSVDAALDIMERQHGEHEPLIRGLLQASVAVRGRPADPKRRVALLGVAQELERELGVHLELEESRVFPALRACLTQDVEQHIIEELRARRALGGTR